MNISTVVRILTVHDPCTEERRRKIDVTFRLPETIPRI